MEREPTVSIGATPFRKRFTVEHTQRRRARGRKRRLCDFEETVCAFGERRLSLPSTPRTKDKGALKSKAALKDVAQYIILQAGGCSRPQWTAGLEAVSKRGAGP